MKNSIFFLVIFMAIVFSFSACSGDDDEVVYRTRDIYNGHVYLSAQEQITGYDIGDTVQVRKLNNNRHKWTVNPNYFQFDTLDDGVERYRIAVIEEMIQKEKPAE